MYNSYYVTSRVDEEMIKHARIDIVDYTKKKMAHELIEKIMDEKEVDLDKVAFRIKFVEYNVRENEGPCPIEYSYIQARLRVIPYA